MRRLDDKFSEVRSGFTVRRTKFLAGRDTINFIRDLLKDLTTVINASVKILHEQLVPAFGPSGTPGNAVQIKRACDNLYSIFLSLYEWEMDVRFVRPHEVFEGIFLQMHGWSEELLSEFHRIPLELNDLLAKPDLHGEYSINLVIVAPKGIPALIEEFDRMANDPRVIDAVTSGG
ncbi:MAG: hypothetical protein HGA87_04995 [Desulfobulbaceae bacterium]|nr:hypothetical protein [Desulfobulbaceae bacterium]